MTLKIAMLGNFQVSYSSESHHAASLEALGHRVERIQEPAEGDWEILQRAQGCDLFVWIHTHGWETPNIDKALYELQYRGVPCVTYHLDLYMPIQRWQRYVDHPYFTHMDHWFTVDPQMATWISENTSAKGHFLPAGVYAAECYLAEPDHIAGNDVIFVGSKGYHPEWPYRAKLIDWLRDTYGDRFTHVGGDGDTGTIRGHELNRVYASSKVAIGDTLCVNFDYPDYWSDRTPETLGRGGFLIHPRIPGMERYFKNGQDLIFYDFNDFDGLKAKIDKFLSPEWETTREKIRLQGHETAKREHTYEHRWETILDAVFG